MNVLRTIVAGFAGAVIAWVVTAIVLHAMFVSGGYTREALVELPPWAFAVIGGGGALAAVGSVWAYGRISLPERVRPVAVGALVGVAVVVSMTLSLADKFGGPSKGQGPYQRAGLVYGVPVGSGAGAFIGLLRMRRRSSTLNMSFPLSRE